MHNPIARFLKTASLIKSRELNAVASSFLFVVILMTAYYILRPVRDAMASDWTDAEVSWLWTLNFFISTAVVAFYGIAVSRFRFRVLVPATYGMFAASFVTFYTLATLYADRTLVDKAFYVWVSVFSLFHISVFWSFMADTYKQEQSRRLFGFIASGSSLGAIFGPAVSFFLAEKVGSNELILISATMLLVPIFIVLYLQKIKETELANTSAAEYNEQAIGSGILAGFKEFALKPILLGIGLFIFISNVLLLFWNSDNKLIIEQNNFLFYISPHLLNLIAVLILTIGWSLHKKSNISLKKFLRILGFYFLGLLILIGKFIWMN